MKENAENKARRRRSQRETFPAPLNQIALRHVDTVKSLDVSRQAILAEALAKVGMVHVATYLATMKSSGDTINNASDLIAALNQSEIPTDNNLDCCSDTRDVKEIDIDSLANLLIKCYPDMPQATAAALARSDIMSLSLRVVSATKHALMNTKSDFVITALYTLFEEKLDEIEQVIASNPTFIKAMQFSRPGWKPK